MTWDEACQLVLREADGALHYSEIAERIVEKRYRGEDVGATPAQTVNATINNSLRQPNSPYVRVRMGEYALRSELRIETPVPETVQRVEESATER